MIRVIVCARKSQAQGWARRHPEAVVTPHLLHIVTDVDSAYQVQELRTLLDSELLWLADPDVPEADWHVIYEILHIMTRGTPPVQDPAFHRRGDSPYIAHLGLHQAIRVEDLARASTELKFAEVRAELDELIATLPWYARAALKIHEWVTGHRPTRNQVYLTKEKDM